MITLVEKQQEEIGGLKEKQQEEARIARIQKHK